MPRPPRITEPGVVYHVLNRRVMRLPLFQKDRDYEAFEKVLAESLERPDAPTLLAYCLMPNHWHLVVLARKSTDLSRWMQWVAVTHTHRRHSHYRTAGEGPLYQGRFKSFPIQEDSHFLTVCRYVEANARRAQLVKRAEAWRWCSLWCRKNGKGALLNRLKAWPVDRPRNWLGAVNEEMREEAIREVRRSVTRGVPYGGEGWQRRVVGRLELELTLRPRGRPRRVPKKSS